MPYILLMMRCLSPRIVYAPVVVPDQLQVYFISGTQDVELNENRLLSIVEDACRGGATCFPI